MQSQGRQGKRHLIDQIVYVASVKAPIHSSKIAVGENLTSSRENVRARPSMIQHFSKTSNSRTKQFKCGVELKKGLLLKLSLEVLQSFCGDCQ